MAQRYLQPCCYRMSLRKTRLLKELEQLQRGFSHEVIKILISEEDLSTIETLKFEMKGPKGTPFFEEILQLEMTLTSRYPLEPPIVRFTTPVRHPNIDEVSGRICLDLLRMPPEGSWRPNVSLGSVLVSVHVLLGSPNLEDPVRPDLISEWQTGQFKQKENTEVDTNASGQNLKDPISNDAKEGKRNFSLSLATLRKKTKIEEQQSSL